MSPEERLVEIITALESVGLSYLVMGGHAVRFYGFQRNTTESIGKAQRDGKV